MTKSADYSHMPLAMRAEGFACACHATQKRKYTGTPYIFHPQRVAERCCAVHGATPVHVAAALLHDVIEDCNVPAQHIEDFFGNHVASLVKELTSTSRNTGLSRTDRKRIDRERLRGVSRWAKIIKLIDRTDNLNEMAGADPDFIVLYCTESTLLLNECLRGVDSELEDELTIAIQNRLFKDTYFSCSC